MISDFQKYTKEFKDLNINIFYSGPMWNDGIKGISEMVKISLSHEGLSVKTSKAIFSVFIEQITNVLMYSAEKGVFSPKSGEASIGTMILGNKGKVYFMQTGNAISNKGALFIKDRIDHLNRLDKEGIRQFYKEMLRSGDDNPDSKGAGLGFIEIAKRVTAPIEYKIEPINDEISYFSMYVEVAGEVE